MTGPIRRVSSLDRPWARTTNSGIVGPLRVPSRADVIDAIVELSNAFPHSRLSWRLNETATRWLTDPGAIRDVASGMVASSTDEPAPDYGRFLTALARRTDLAQPASFVLTRDHAALRVSHAVGDGRVVAAFLSGVLSTASTGQLPAWSPTPGIPHPYRKAVVEFFGRSPRRLAELANRPKSTPSPESSEVVSWSPDAVTLYRRASRDAVEAVREWRSRNARGSSMPSIELTLLLRAFRAAGVALRPDVLTLFDARRYVPRDYVDGNFVVGLLIPATARHTVGEIGAAISATSESGRPLAALGLGLLTHRRPAPTPLTAPSRSAAQLAFTHIGRPQSIERLGFVAGEIPVYAGALDPAGPTGITVATTRTGGTLQLSVTMHANVTDVTAVSHALDLIADDPVALLEDGATRHRPTLAGAAATGADDGIQR
ncbi:MAG: hypothetical protein QOC60_1936 [Frankiaceae bacterium]|nr:hypothetical protein [Frankiaceae bacterium]